MSSNTEMLSLIKENVSHLSRLIQTLADEPWYQNASAGLATLVSEVDGVSDALARVEDRVTAIGTESTRSATYSSENATGAFDVQSSPSPVASSLRRAVLDPSHKWYGKEVISVYDSPTGYNSEFGSHKVNEIEIIPGAPGYDSELAAPHLAAAREATAKYWNGVDLENAGSDRSSTVDNVSSNDLLDEVLSLTSTLANILSSLSEMSQAYQATEEGTAYDIEGDSLATNLTSSAGSSGDKISDNPGEVMWDTITDATGEESFFLEDFFGDLEIDWDAQEISFDGTIIYKANQNAANDQISSDQNGDMSENGYVTQNSFTWQSYDYGNDYDDHF